MKKRTLIVFTILFFICGCAGNHNEKHTASFFSFDTYIQFDAYTKDQKTYDKYFNLTKKEFDYYHKLFDAYHNYDNLNNLKTVNDNAGKKAIKVDENLYKVIKIAKEYYQTGMQKNNITLAPVILVYQDIMDQYEKGKTVKKPKQSLLEQRAKCTDINNIELRENNTIYLKKACAKIDVGSVAKGYVADKIASKLETEDLESGIINAGGNVVLIGKKPNNSDYSIGIANPDDPNNYRVLVNSSDTNIVTSGDYQRFYIIDNVKYNHIIDPDTLQPAMKNKSVTIITKDGLKADYFSTECFMLDKSEIQELAKKFSFDYIVIDKNNKITVSEGIKDEVKIK